MFYLIKPTTLQMEKFQILHKISLRRRLNPRQENLNQPRKNPKHLNVSRKSPRRPNLLRREYQNFPKQNRYVKRRHKIIFFRKMQDCILSNNHFLNVHFSSKNVIRTYSKYLTSKPAVVVERSNALFYLMSRCVRAQGRGFESGRINYYFR